MRGKEIVERKTFEVALYNPLKFAWPLNLGTQTSVRIILAAAVVLAATMFLCRGAILFTQIADLHSLAAASLVFRATMADWAVCWIVAFAFIFVAKRTQRHHVVAYSFLPFTVG